MAVQPKPLRACLPSDQIPPAWRDLLICNLQLDSRWVRPGDAFVALAPSVEQRTAHIQQAMDAGAALIMVDPQQAPPAPQSWAAACLPLANLAARLPSLAADFYAHPSRHLRLIGVTGTNGKSTCVYLLAQLMAAISGAPAGLLGTLGYGLSGEELLPTGMTTPDLVSNQRILSELRQRGAAAVAMEVSSHGLVQQRLAGLDFSAAIFTNLSRDHLDYHQTMEAYGQAKQQLFDWPSLHVAAINFDDTQGPAMATRLPAGARLLSYGLHAPSAALLAEDVVFTSQGAEFTLQSPWGSCRLESPLMGAFNVHNLLACLAITLHFYPAAWAQLPARVRELKPVAGRMQQIRQPNQPVVVVDYAHTPDALEQALLNLRRHCSGKLRVVFGCGGERDLGKRPQMAAIAERLADCVVVTSDNPRGESPTAIVADIRQGFARPESVVEIADRAEAIARTIAHAQPDDWILIAGKGHENYQLIGDQRLAFDDVQQAHVALALRGAD